MLTRTDRASHARSGLLPFGRITKAYVTERKMHAEYVGYPRDPRGLVFYGGKILDVVTVPGYIFIEAERLPADNRPDDGGAVYWHTYIRDLKGNFWSDTPDGGDVTPLYDSSHIYSTLDEALVHAISVRAQTRNFSLNVAINSQVPELFWRMVGGTP